MKSTANLGLNLYEATDYVLHDSFNSDNQSWTPPSWPPIASTS